MSKRLLYQSLRILFCIVWLFNGLYCKVLGFVPRHEAIVAKILHLDSHQAHSLTIIIGVLEILMAIWILSGKYKRLNIILQIVLVGVMNILEFSLAKELLLWGHFNLVFAICFMMLLYFSEFMLGKSNSTNNAH